MSRPEDIANDLDRARQALQSGELMQRIVFLVEAEAKRRTPVRTGTLRRSVTGRVDSPTRGRVGTNVVYARPVHEGTSTRRGRPFLVQGMNAARPAIERELQRFGLRLWSEVG